MNTPASPSSSFNYKDYFILYVDDENKSLKYFTQAFSDKFSILTADNAQEGFELFKAHVPRVAILITDQQMPREKGTQFLERARAFYPYTLRILATAYADLQSAIEAVNSGAIYKFITKPWDIPQLEIMLLRGVEFYILQQERERLIREKMDILQELITRERILSLGILSAGLSHHLNNAMTAIKTFLDLAPLKLQSEIIDPHQLKDPEFWHDFHHQAQQQTQRIASLLQQLSLADPHQHTLMLSTVQLDQLLQQIIQHLRPHAEQKSISIKFTSSTTIPPLNTDEEKLEQALRLILKDEITVLPHQSTITIDLSHSPPNHLKLLISDDGPSLTEEALQSLFNPFFQRNDELPQEYGVHLMAAYLLIHQIKGKIQAQSHSPNKGTTFTITLPLTYPTDSEPSPPPIQSFLQNQQILESILSGKR
ncbi:MAG: hybrid sensor histidine kinase/response regulator [Verrucomicrobiae bacterium]|nr:hybrid sensor histidine kinase/response regulator [Verrucomicrobiae bacterium]